MKKLDILFVHPNAAQEIYQGLANEHSAIEMPIWAALLANHVRSRGHSCQILDCEVERLTVSESAQRIVDENPKVVCFVVSLSLCFLFLKEASLPALSFPQKVISNRFHLGQ